MSKCKCKPCFTRVTLLLIQLIFQVALAIQPKDGVGEQTCMPKVQETYLGLKSYIQKHTQVTVTHPGTNRARSCLTFLHSSVWTVHTTLARWNTISLTGPCKLISSTFSSNFLHILHTPHSSSEYICSMIPHTTSLTTASFSAPPTPSDLH